MYFSYFFLFATSFFIYLRVRWGEISSIVFLLLFRVRLGNTEHYWRSINCTERGREGERRGGESNLCYPPCPPRLLAPARRHVFVAEERKQEERPHAGPHHHGQRVPTKEERLATRQPQYRVALSQLKQKLVIFFLSNFILKLDCCVSRQPVLCVLMKTLTFLVQKILLFSFCCRKREAKFSFSWCMITTTTAS